MSRYTQRSATQRFGPLRTHHQYQLIRAEYAGTSNNSFWSTLWEQAVAQGQTVFVSTGDSGVASSYGVSINGIASNEFTVAVGGNLHDASARAMPRAAGHPRFRYGAARGTFQN